MDKKEPKVVKIYRYMELPPIEQMKEFIVKEGRAERKNATVIDKYYVMGTINQEMYRAARKLYEDAYIGGVLSELKGIDPTRFLMPGGGVSYRADEISWMKADKQRQFSQAMNYIDLKAENKDILWHVAIFDFTLYSFNKNTKYTKRLLCESLDILIKHYKVQRNGRHPK